MIQTARGLRDLGIVFVCLLVVAAATEDGQASFGQSSPCTGLACSECSDGSSRGVEPEWACLAQLEAMEAAVCSAQEVGEPGELKELRARATSGDPEAQTVLADRYALGRGVDQDFKEAVKWLRMAAEQGVAEAQYQIGLAYLIGGGVLEDDKEAVKWSRMAAEQGSSAARVLLGIAYENGQGVLQDFVRAYAWFNLAALGAYPDAPRRRSEIAERMTPQQIQEAQRLSRELLDAIGGR
jgi:hypothetical protein